MLADYYLTGGQTVQRTLQLSVHPCPAKIQSIKQKERRGGTESERQADENEKKANERVFGEGKRKREKLILDNNIRV